MSPEEARRTQRPYRYGMILLCFGALINWVGLAEHYTEPIRYAGVACIICGALLICTAMCCWLHSPQRNSVGATAEVCNFTFNCEKFIINTHIYFPRRTKAQCMSLTFRNNYEPRNRQSMRRAWWHHPVTMMQFNWARPSFCRQRLPTKVMMGYEFLWHRRLNVAITQVAAVVVVVVVVAV